MAINHRVIRYRLKPQTKSKAKMLHRHCGASRYVWNHFVSVLRDEYLYYGKSDYRFFSLAKRFTNLRLQKKWLNELSCANVKQILKGIEITYKNFFNNKEAGLPKFKSKWGKQSFLLASYQTFKIEGQSIYIQKIGWMAIQGNNPYPNAKAVNGTIKNECGKWYAYIDYKVESEEHEQPHEVKVVGIDRNVGQIATSDGEIIHLPDTTKLEKRKKHYQKMLARRKCGSRKHKVNPSNRYLKACLLHQKTSQKIAQARTNWCHQVSRKIANTYDAAILEDLKTKNLTISTKGEGHKAKAGLNRVILNSAWGKFEQCLDYKMKMIKVPAPYTSQTCSECGHIDRNNRKAQADFKCLKCGFEANADINASINIRASGIGVIGHGKTMKRVKPNIVECQNDLKGKGQPLCI